MQNLNGRFKIFIFASALVEIKSPNNQGLPIILVNKK
jgi:hypothetical protein